MAARITRVALRDYRSIGTCDVELQPLTLLVGPNGSGKSTFLDALIFLADSMRAPLERVISDRFGIRSLLRKMSSGRIASSFSIQVNFELDSSTSGVYMLMIGEGPEGGAVIEEERCTVGEESFTLIRGALKEASLASPAFTGDRPALVSFGSLPAFAPVFNLVAGLAFYDPDPRCMQKPVPAGAGTALKSDASNAVDVLARIEKNDPQVVARIRGYLMSFNPEFASVKGSGSGQYRWLAFTPSVSPSGWEMIGSDVSGGTLRAVGILLAIFAASSSIPPVSLVILEEPEINLHPAAAGVLLDALLEASYRVPVVVATHSADLLDRPDLPDDALLAVALHGGETIIGPVNESGRSMLRQRLYTAGELLRTNQLAPSVPATVE